MVFRVFGYLFLDVCPIMFVITLLHQPHGTTAPWTHPGTCLPPCICSHCYPGWCSYSHVFTCWNSIRPSRFISYTFPSGPSLPHSPVPGTYTFIHSLSCSFVQCHNSPPPSTSPPNLCNVHRTLNLSCLILYYMSSCGTLPQPMQLDHTCLEGKERFAFTYLYPIALLVKVWPKVH